VSEAKLVVIYPTPTNIPEFVIVSAYAIQAEVAYIFLRAEYTLAARCLTQAIS
jgi:NADH-quinone oxidoreductase subunit F